MVVTRLPATAETGTWQERMASPSRCTVQAPQTPTPQPYFVPVRPRRSRRIQRSGVSGSAASTERGRELTVRRYRTEVLTNREGKGFVGSRIESGDPGTENPRHS